MNEKTLQPEERQIVLGALDSLAVALSEHNHQWTEGQREIYEQAIQAVLMETLPA